MFGMPIFSLIAIFRFGRRIRRAQARAGQRMMVLPPSILVIGMLVPPVAFAYVQKELNRLWAVEGQPLDPWPAAVGSEASASTAPLPWLKTRLQLCRRQSSVGQQADHRLEGAHDLEQR
jgi:hypothetical protein